ncbi:hypothetical protein TH61_11575 [Rufibacter sp. DG15C]|uniref:STAS/SEC14 domain-containing protein n=1 Tax=Rufibacter sp. DG15C TaxID=1379909 RepID=UPI00078E957A|nr:STAS/SEC14 domain-containing protein [Rufibacter sp. DG15C]AMM51693.1 hypothetical protein TH61_11575 [Rufibacter sp. DG15C]
MTLEVQMEEPLATYTIDTNDARRSLTLHWRGFVSSEVYHEGMLEALKTSRQAGHLFWILDTKDMKVIRQADQEWTVATWFPQFQLLGVRKFAIVVSDDIFNQMAISSMIAKIRPHIQATVEYFQTMSEALNWVQESKGLSSDSSLFSGK